MSMMTLLMLLVAGHVLADFYLQPSNWVRLRAERHFSARCLYWHGIVHAALAAVMLMMSTTLNPLAVAAYALFLGSTHIVIDGIKSYAPPTTFTFVLDQLAHLVIIAVVVVMALPSQQAGLVSEVSALLTRESLAIAVGYLLVLRPVSIVIKQTLAPWSNAIGAGRGHELSEPSLQAAGQSIGYLERVLILTFILLNQFSAIGFLLAAKSVFRFGDLRHSEDKKLTEYVMLGTLISFTLTIAIGLLVSSIATQVPIGK